MEEQADQTDDDGDTRRGGSQDHQRPHRGQTQEQTRADPSDQCRFDDFAMI